MKKNFSKILLIGKHGQIASQILKQFKNKKILTLSSKQINFENKNFLNKIRKIKPNIIINAAAFTNVDQAEIEKKKAMRVNGYAIKELSSFCKKNNIFLFHFSTDYIFNGNSKSPIRENEKPSPINYYGLSKKIGEDFIIKSKCNYIILRVCWIYSNRPGNFVTKIATFLSQNKKLKIISDQFGSPTSAKLIAKITIKLIKKIKFNERKIFNVSCIGKTSWFGVSREIKKLIDIKYPKNTSKIKKIKSSEYNSLAKRPSYSYLNTKKLRQELNINLPYWKDELYAFLNKYLINKEFILNTKKNN